MEVSRIERLKFAKHFERAQGWLLLDKYVEAIAALDEIPSSFQGRTEVLVVRAHIHQSACQWSLAETIFRQLLALDATVPQYWISLAYAVRRAKSIQEAESILGEARRRFPDIGLIAYNLACYAAQQKRLPEAQRLLIQAIRSDASLHELAKTDDDLSCFWDKLNSGHFSDGDQDQS